MRKKYLSALLFGALLLASAGTFTSCKDYDDDIKNLQEQINTVKTSLDELTTKVNSLGAGVKEFKYENGKLILVTDKDTNFEVELPACDGIKELEIKNGILYADGVEVGPIGGEGTTIEGDKVEVKDGILYINDKPQDLKDEVGSKVIVIDNNDGTYTLTVGSDSYVLPKASADVAVKVLDENGDVDYYFTNFSSRYKSMLNPWDGGIQWGTADKYRGNWGGLKAVEKGKLLVGQISPVKVRVLSATFDLSTANLSLVNTLGEKAPVTITPVAEGKLGPAVGSRSADQNGVWDLKIEMNSSVTPENIDVAFAAKDASDAYAYKNVKYALAVDGKVATDYVIYVDTEEKKATDKFQFNSVNLAFKVDGMERRLFDESLFGNDIDDETNTNEKGIDGKYTSGTQTLDVTIPIDATTTLYLTHQNNVIDNDVDLVYDSYIEILDKDLADAKGIKAKGMDLIVSEDAKALKGLRVRLHVLDVNGNETKSQVLTLNFASARATGQEIADQTYTVMPSTAVGMEFILVDLGNTFTSLTADEADKISKANASGSTGYVTWYSTTDNKVFDLTGDIIEGGLKEINHSSEILYYAKKEDALKYGLIFNEKHAIRFDGTQTIDTEAPTIREIAYAVIPVSSVQKVALPNTNAPFTISLKDADKNELKKVSANLALNVPAFDDVLVANSDQNLWVDGVFNTRVIATGVGAGNITLVKAYKSKADANGVAYIDLNATDKRLVYNLSYVDLEEDAQYLDEVSAATIETLKGTIVKDGKLMHDINVEATLYPMGKDYKNFKATKAFNVYLKSVFEDAEIAYYGADGKPVTGAMTLENYKYIYPGYVSGNAKHGLFVNFDGETQPFNLTNGVGFTTGCFANVQQISTIKPSFVEASGLYDVFSYLYLGDGSIDSVTPDDTTFDLNGDGSKDRVLEISNAQGSTGGQLIFTFVDKMGVEWTKSISYKK